MRTLQPTELKREVDVGILRLFLALSVVAAHAGSSVLGMPAANANIAVNLFFVISGFYMSMVLTGKYSDVPLRAFYLNRALRLFPIYLLGTAFALAVTIGPVVQFFQGLQGWGRLYYLVTNVVILGQDLGYILCVPSSSGCAAPYSLSINPPAWTLSVELGFYLVAPFVLRSPKRTYLFVVAGLALVTAADFIPPSVFGNAASVAHLAPESPFVFDYYFFPSSFLFFGLGALAQQISSGRSRFRYGPGLLLVLGAMVARAPTEFWQTFVFAAAVPVLFRLTSKNRVDRFVGELSYPVYILHFPVLDAMRATLPASSWVLSPAWVGSVLAGICIAVGLLLHVTVESATTRFRHRLVRADVPALGPVEGAGPAATLFPAVLLPAYFGFPVLLLGWVFLRA